MSDPLYAELKQERLDTYKRVWKIFLWFGWPAAFLTMWLGGWIIGKFHNRIQSLQAENRQLRSARETTPQK